MRSTFRIVLVVFYSAAVVGQSRVDVASAGGRMPSSHHSPLTTFGQPVTVETGTEEIPNNEGFLECVTEQLQGTLAHSGTADMVQKLQSGIVLGKDAVIVGHGAPGILCTGNGDHCSGNQDMLAYSTAATWEPLIGQVKGKFKSITLVGCEVGEGTAGTSFLSALAKATGATVRAPNDIVSCNANGITILNGGMWVQIDPSSTRVLARPRQTPATSSETYKFKVGSEFVSVPTSNVKVISFQHRAYGQQEYVNLTLPPEHSLLTLINFGNPIQIRGSIGSIVTGRLTIQVTLDNHPVERHFILLNDEMFEDRENPTVYYKTTSAFVTTLSSLLR